MKKKISKRFPTDLRGVIILDEKRYVGNLKNVSEEGICYLISDCVYKNITIIPKKRVKVVFLNPSDKVLSLNCEIIWSDGPSIDSSKSYLGLKVIDPTQTYKDFVNTLEQSPELDAVYPSDDLQVSFSPKEDYYLNS